MMAPLAAQASMRVLLAPVGSRGDVAPLVALGQGLQRRGHDVVVLTSSDMVAWVEGQGLRAVDGGSDIGALIRRHHKDLHRPAAVFRILVREARRALQEQLDALDGIVAGFDLVVGAGIQLAAPSVAAAHGVPYRTVFYTPSALVSAEHPPFWLPWRRLPRWLNPWLHLLPDAVNGRIALGALRRYCAAHALPPPHLPLWAMAGERPLLAADLRLLQREATAATLPAAAAPFGCWPPPEVVGWLGPGDEPALDAEVEAFLAAGAPPVYLGFGSMVDRDAAATLASAAALCRALDVRVVVVRGWSARVAAPAEPRLLVVDGAPHGRLLPRCLASVHHGGMGTTHAAARAGVPQLLVPHLLDQFDAAARIAALGVGPPAVARGRFDEAALIAVVAQMRADAAMRARAAALGAALRGHDGVAHTVAVLERFVADWHATEPSRRGPWAAARHRAGRPFAAAPAGLPAGTALAELPPPPRMPWRRPAFLLGLAAVAVALTVAAWAALR